MSICQKRIIGSAVVLMLVLTALFLFSKTFPPEGSVPLRDIVSYSVGDATEDSALKLLAITGDGKIDSGERHGQFLLVCGASAEADIIKHGYIPPEKIEYRIDLSGIKPMKVQLGDVNGDGINEVAVCVYKTTKFHPDMAKRPFFFDLVDGNLIPVWLGSRLSRPFDDYILYDIDNDASDEIISIERLESGERVITAYNWQDFGFEMLTESEGFDGELRFDSGTAGQTAEPEETNSISVILKEQTRLIFRLDDGKLVYTKQN